MKKQVQRSMHCSCGNAVMVARGLCGTCYVMKRQDEKYYGGLREAVLDRDGRRCRVCDVPGGRKRSLAVHHRVPGCSDLHLMITLCLGCHAKVSRTMSLCADWPELLRVLWREQHPNAHEQLPLDFSVEKIAPKPVSLFRESKEGRGNGGAMESMER